MNTKAQHTKRITWTGLIVSLALAITIAGGTWQILGTWRLVYLGKSPMRALELTQEEISYFLLNPWILAPYALLLSLGAWQLFSPGATKPKPVINYWLGAALLVSLAVVLFNLFHTH